MTEPTAAALRPLLPTIGLARLLRENDAPCEMDYWSIDIEGAEEQVLTVFPFDQYRFNCMTIERPPAALRHLLSTHGYRLIKDIPGLDCFYVHSGFLDKYATNMIAHYAKKYLTIPMG
jgi:hypothetical protein